MTYPIPTHREIMQLGQLEVEGGKRLDSDPQMFKGAQEALYEFLRSHTYQFHGSSEGQNGTYKKNSAMTPEGIVIHIVGNYTDDWDRTPINLDVELLSFTSPINDLARDLVEIAKDGARKYLPVKPASS